MKIAVILPAAGIGKRFAQSGEVDDLLGSTSKLEADLAGRPVFLRAIECFVGRPQVGPIILAVNPDNIDAFRFKWGDTLALHDVKITPGGRQERWETVMLSLEQVPDDCTHVAVHDAARPLAGKAMIDRLFDAAARYSAVIPAIATSNTLKRVIDESDVDEPYDPLDAILGDAGRPKSTVRRVTATVDRSDIVEVQTPQVFEISLLRRAYQQVRDGKVSGSGITDDAGLVEALGDSDHPVRVVDGDVTNIKITRPDDLKLAHAIHQALHAQADSASAKKRLFADDDDE